MTTFHHNRQRQCAGLIAQGRRMGFAVVMLNSPVKAGVDATQ